MPLELSEPLQQALDAQPDVPLCLVDPRTQQTYVLLRQDVYQRWQDQLYDDAEFPIQAAYPLMDAVAAKEGWDAPEMDSYNECAHEQQP